MGTEKQESKPQFTVRPAVESELVKVYMMGFDEWSEGADEATYLEVCRTSPKYKKGSWWVLEESTGELTSSLIIYDFGAKSFGIGSIATPVALRNHGHASALIQKVMEQLFLQHQPKAVFLYSDIRPDFYERFGFVSLPDQHQQHKPSVCMVKTHPENPTPWLESGFVPPSYF